MRVQPKPVRGPVTVTATVSVAIGWVRRLTVLVVVLGLGLLLAPGALAGGPTSVLVTSPLSGEAAALYASDANYGRLEALLGPPGRGDRERPLSLDSSVGTRQINVAWMALDLTPSRVDRVFPGGDPDTIWIHTASGTPATYRGLWHRAAKPAELAALFKELGLMGPPSTVQAGMALFPRPWEDDATAAPPASESGPEATAAGAYGLLDHWWWAIPGLAMGAALTLAALRAPDAWRKRGQRAQGPRQQLLDR